MTRIRSLPAAVLGALLFVSSAAAQTSGNGFLFGRPGAILNVYGGVGQPTANSDIYTFVTDQLTLSEKDFAGVAAGASVLFPVGDRVDLSLGATYMGKSAGSEFRDWVGTDDLPIEQTTQLVRVPVLAGVRYNVLPRGESIGNLAWVPSRLSAHVSAAGGVVWYRFRQEGEFVDVLDEDKAIFADELLSEGWTQAGQLSAGVDLSLTTRLGLTADANYLWSRATLSRDFEDFDPIDLSGFSVLVGFSLRV